MEGFIGEIIMFGGNFAPRFWAFCNGQLLAIAQNQALFSILGTTYGGDGRTTFGLPDLRGRAAMHTGQGPGLTSRQLGQRGGTEANTLTVSQIPSHTHQLNAKEEGNSDNPSGGFIAGSGANSFGTSADAVMAANAVQPVGNNAPINNMQPYECVSYIICLQGIFPSRN